MRLGRGFRRAGARQEQWYVRVLRGLRPDRNPLRRTSDRVQFYLLAGLFVVAATAAPFAAQLASHAAYATALRAEQAQLASTHQVRARLTQLAAGTVSEGVVAASTVNANVVASEVPVRATWTSVTGVRRTGLVMAPPGTPAGASVAVWTDAAGDLTSPPLQPSEVAGQGELAAVGAITGVGLLCLCAAVVIRHVAYRRGIAAWERDWVVTAQSWNRQRW